MTTPRRFSLPGKRTPGQRELAAGTNNLVATGEILKRRAPDMNQAGEREEQENSHSQHQMKSPLLKRELSEMAVESYGDAVLSAAALADALRDDIILD